MKKALSILIAIPLVLSASCRTHPSSNSRIITREDAIAIADNECRKVMNIPQHIEPVCTETETAYTITYPTIPSPGLRQGDYYCRIVIDKETGEVIQKLGSS